jgi:cell division protein FtsL
MKTQFDLRPAGMLEKERKQKSFNLTRLIAFLLLFVYFATSIGYLVVMTMERFTLENEVNDKEGLVANLEMEKNGLQRQVNDLKAKEKVFADTLQIMQDDLPTIEVLKALEESMPESGIGFNTLKFVIGRMTPPARGTRGPAVKAPDVVELTGVVATDKLIIDFSDRLRASGVFSDVLLPVTTLNERTNMISFTLRMPVFPIGQIKAQ